MDGMASTERIETVVVGGGQAGLATGYRLARRGLPFVILDASDRVGDAWRNRWDSLRLFTPARYDGLPGIRFPAGGGTFPTKDEMADYLEAYAERFHLPVRPGVRVDGLSRSGDTFVISAGPRRFEADNVVVAMANFQRPKVPPFAKELDPGIVQLHSSDYRNPAQLLDGAVLVVGVGNSGAEIAMELVRGRTTWLAGSEPGHVPFRIETPIGRYGLVRLVRFVGHHVLTVRTPVGRKIRPEFIRRATSLIRVKPKDFEPAGIRRVPRVVGARGGNPLLDDGQVLEVSNVIWATGFHPGFAWIDLPVFGEDGQPDHHRGVVASEPGLYFVGMEFLYAATSATITGVARDARRVANAVAVRHRTRRPAEAVA